MSAAPLLPMAIFTAVIAAVSFAIIRFELMSPGVDLFVQDGAPDGYQFNVAYVVTSVSAVVAASGVLGALAARVVDVALAWPVAGAAILLGLLASPLPVLLRGTHILPVQIMTAVPMAASVFFSMFCGLALRNARRVVLIWLIAGIIGGMSITAVAAWIAVSVGTTSGGFLDTYFVRASEIATGALCISIGLPLAIALRHPVDPMAGYRGIAIVLAFGTLASLFCLIGTYVLLGRMGMPVFYLDYPQVYAFWNFVATLAAYALIAFTILGLIQALLLPRAPSEAEIFA
ncbi:MAG: hypothetical protein AAGJ28_15510 [Pseudomonadota bacterium]